MREDWIEVKLGEICEIISGKSQKAVESSSGKYPIYGSGGIFGRADAYLCEPGTTVIGRKGTINSPIFVNERFWNVDTAFGISPLKEIDSKYVFYFCNGFNFHKLDKSTTIPSLAKRDLLAIEFKLAPLPEQRAIVAKIEQLFSELDNGITNLKAAKDKLEIYRQAVLKKAFEGEWETCTVGNKFKFLGGGTPKKSIPEYWNGDIPWCSVKDVKGDFLYKTKDYITELGLKESSTNIAEIGEVILITRISPGKSIIPKIRTAINQDLKIVSPIDDYSPKFTHYLFKSIKREMLKKSNGTTVLGINLNNLKDISIPDIPEEDQNHVIEFIESRLSICENVLANIEEGLNKSEALRQSILKQAFEGKLLSEEELEACRAAPDWEPAEQLLERIKNQKEGTA